MVKIKTKIRDLQSFLLRNEKDIIQIILALVLILYMIIYRFAR